LRPILRPPPWRAPGVR